MLASQPILFGDDPRQGWNRVIKAHSALPQECKWWVSGHICREKSRFRAIYRPIPGPARHKALHSAALRAPEPAKWCVTQAAIRNRAIRGLGPGLARRELQPIRELAHALPETAAGPYPPSTNSPSLDRDLGFWAYLGWQRDGDTQSGGHQLPLRRGKDVHTTEALDRVEIVFQWSGNVGFSMHSHPLI